LTGPEVWRDSKEGLMMEQASAVVTEFIDREGRTEFDKLKEINIRSLSTTILDA
jgi:hypothetical protein